MTATAAHARTSLPAGSDILQQLVPFDASAIEAVDPPSAFGPPSNFMWVDIDQLRIDPSYQREMREASVKRIREIAGGFTWRLFRTIMVARVAPQVYAVIDGQHRVMAALLAGLTKVPAELVVADRAQQAAAFSAINTRVTRVHSMGAFRAEVAAGDPDAIAIQEACLAAAVRVLSYPVQRASQQVGDTMSIGALRQVYKASGADVLTLVLRCITSGNKPRPGAVSSAAIQGIHDSIKNAPAWLAKRDTLPAVFADTDLLAIVENTGEPGTGRQRVKAVADRLCEEQLGSRIALKTASSDRMRTQDALAFRNPAPAVLVTAPADHSAAIMPRKRVAIADGPEFERLCKLAYELAISNWPVRIDLNAVPKLLRVSAAVALVEHGLDDPATRRWFDLEDSILPARAVMPDRAHNLATKILEALKEPQ